MKDNFLSKLPSLPILMLLFFLVYALGSRQAQTSVKQGGLNAIAYGSSLKSLGKSCRVTAPLLNVRSSPNGEIIGTLKRDDSVTLNGSSGNWIKTDSGYVYGNYVSCVKSS